MRDSNPADRSPHPRDEFRTVIEHQLQQPDLEKVTRAVDWLMEHDHSREQAIDTVGVILLKEMLTKTGLFERERYAERLRNR